MINERIQSAWTIQQLTRYIKLHLESEPRLQDIWVRGEISNFNHHTSGHMYFTLKDENSRVRAVMFASYNRRIAFIPRDGTKVLARGNVSVYERDGQYQFYVTEMQPDGIGSLYLAYEQLKKKLEAEGLFREDRKRSIPAFPETVGVVTSPTGAAVRDIITTLKRRMPSVNVLLCPVTVQGKHAAPSIVNGIERLNERGGIDVIIVGRGGGSIEELWAFNEETVARAIAASQIPIISAVGHETDFTIADFVADLRAATPTAAAELAVPHHVELKQSLLQVQHRLRQALLEKLQRNKERLQTMRRASYFMYPKKHLLESSERLDRLTDRLQYYQKALLAQKKERLTRLERSLYQYDPRRELRHAGREIEAKRKQLILSMRRKVDYQWQAWQAHLKHLDALSPLKVMQRGYSVVYDEPKKQIVKSIEQVQPGDLVHVMLYDGELHCQVWSMKGEGNNDG